MPYAKKKMVLFHIAAIGWISTQTGYKISTQNWKTKIETYSHKQDDAMQPNKSLIIKA